MRKDTFCEMPWEKNPMLLTPRYDSEAISVDPMLKKETVCRTWWVPTGLETGEPSVGFKLERIPAAWQPKTKPTAAENLMNFKIIRMNKIIIYL